MSMMRISMQPIIFEVRWAPHQFIRTAARGLKAGFPFGGISAHKKAAPRERRGMGKRKMGKVLRTLALQPCAGAATSPGINLKELFDAHHLLDATGLVLVHHRFDALGNAQVGRFPR